MSNLTVELNYFLYPSSIAVISDSPTPGGTGCKFVGNLIRADFRGKLYAVNPNLKEIMGMKAYNSIMDIPQGVDLVILAVQSSSFPEIIQECGSKGVKAAIISSGFSGVSDDGKKLEHKVLEVARRHGIRIIGPNTQGIINATNNLMAFTDPDTLPKLTQGKGISYICQTIYFFEDWVFRNQGRGLTKAVNLGVMCDLTNTELLEYFGDDPETRVIVLQIDQIRDGREFIKVARQVTQKKPVIAIKAGRTQVGVRAVVSHTGSLAGSGKVYDAVFRQVGIIRARDTDELIDLTKTFAYLSPMPTGNRVAIISLSGAASSLAADACVEYGLSLAELSKTTIQKIGQVIPSWTSIGNPIDLLQSPEVDRRVAHSTVLEALFTDPNVDAIMIIQCMAGTFLEQFNIFNILKECIREGPKKPIVMSGLMDDEGLKQSSRLDLAGIITFSSIRRSIKALAAAYSRYRYLNQ